MIRFALLVGLLLVACQAIEGRGDECQTCGRDSSSGGDEIVDEVQDDSGGADQGAGDTSPADPEAVDTDEGQDDAAEADDASDAATEIDAGDADNDSSPDTEVVPESACLDGLDNDSDGHADCADSDCVPSVACPEVCNDAVDNDADNKSDCDDPNCASASVCFSVCNSLVDQDGDGVPCAADPVAADPYACGDDDGDTCDDCAVTGNISASGGDGPDNDVDGLCDAGDDDDDNDGDPDADDCAPDDPMRTSAALDAWDGEGDGPLALRPNAMNRGGVTGVGALDPDRNLFVTWNEQDVLIFHYNKDANASVAHELVGRVNRSDFIARDSGAVVRQEWDDRTLVLFWKENWATHSSALTGLDITDPAVPVWETVNGSIAAHPPSHSANFSGRIVASTKYVCVAAAEGGIIVFDRAPGYPLRAILHDDTNNTTHWRTHYRLQVIATGGREVLASNGNESVYVYDVTDLPQGVVADGFEVSSAYLGAVTFPTTEAWGFPASPNKFTRNFMIGRVPGTAYVAADGRSVERLLLALGFRYGVQFADVTALIEDAFAPSSPITPVGSFWFSSAVEPAYSVYLKNRFLITGFGGGGPGEVRLVAFNTDVNMTAVQAYQVYRSRLTTVPEPLAANHSLEILERPWEDADDGLLIGSPRIVWAFAAWSADTLNDANASQCIADMQAALQTYNQNYGKSETDIRNLAWNLNAYTGLSSYTPLCPLAVVDKAGESGEHGDWLEGAAYSEKHHLLVLADWALGYRVYDVNDPSAPIEAQHWLYEREFPLTSYAKTNAHIYGLQPRDVAYSAGRFYATHGHRQDQLGVLIFDVNTSSRKLVYRANVRDNPMPTTNRQYDRADQLAAVQVGTLARAYVVVARLDTNSSNYYLSAIDTETDTFRGTWVPPLPSAGTRRINGMTQAGERLYAVVTDVNNSLETLRLLVVALNEGPQGLEMNATALLTVGAAAPHDSPGEGRKIQADPSGHYLYMTGHNLQHGGYLFDISGANADAPLLLQSFPRKATSSFWAAHPVDDGPTADAILVGNRLLIDTNPRSLWQIDEGNVTFVGFQQGTSHFRAVAMMAGFAVAAGLYGGTHLYPLCASE